MKKLASLFSLIVFLVLIGCGEDPEKSVTPFFKLGNTNYATDYTTCKTLGADYQIAGFRKSGSTTDNSCELVFFEHTTPPPEGEYTIQGLSNNQVEGYVDLIIRGPGFTSTYLATEGTVTVQKSNGKTEIIFSAINFRASDGTILVGSGQFKCN